MSLQSIYESFLASPKADVLAQDASLSYITTLTTVSDASAIIKHLEVQRKAIKKRVEKTLNAIADRHALFLEVETVMEFVTGGGPYLPGLDTNFIVDQVVELPLQHVVHFDSDGKIKQIRIYWDQASLLKTVEVIGSRASSWPIKDGKEQIRLITSSAKASEFRSSSETTSRRQSSTRATKDPHGTLEPFAAHIPEEDETERSYNAPAIKPRASAKPAQREWDELFVSEQGAQERGVSPSKADIIAPKAGAGKNYGENRLFGEAQSPSNEITQKFKSPHPAKFNHFEFDDGHNDEGPTRLASRPKTKHQSQWDFSDFTTPVKPNQRIQDQRTFAFDEQIPEESPVRKPLREQNTHFELQDDGESEQRKYGHSRGERSAQINRKTLFSNNVISEQGAAESTPRGRPLSTIANVKDRQKTFGNHWDLTDNPSHGDDQTLGTGANIKDRSKDFDPHFQMVDSPSGADKIEDKKPLGGNQGKVVQMMQSNWESSDPSPSGKENRLMGIAGNGMGGRKGVEREWGFGDHDQPTQQSRPVRKNMGNQRSELWDM